MRVLIELALIYIKPAWHKDKACMIALPSVCCGKHCSSHLQPRGDLDACCRQDATVLVVHPPSSEYLAFLSLCELSSSLHATPAEPTWICLLQRIHTAPWVVPLHARGCRIHAGLFMHVGDEKCTAKREGTGHYNSTWVLDALQDALQHRIQ